MAFAWTEPRHLHSLIIMGRSLVRTSPPRHNVDRKVDVPRPRITVEEKNSNASQNRWTTVFLSWRCLLPTGVQRLVLLVTTPFSIYLWSSQVWHKTGCTTEKASPTTGLMWRRLLLLNHWSYRSNAFQKSIKEMTLSLESVAPERVGNNAHVLEGGEHIVS